MASFPCDTCSKSVHSRAPKELGPIKVLTFWR